MWSEPGDAEGIIDLTTSLHSLLQSLGKPRLLERVAEARDAAAASLGDVWNHTQFELHRTRIEQHLASGRQDKAFGSARQLLERARAEGDEAYRRADYDMAVACFLLARVLWFAGRSEEAIPLLDEAQGHFNVIAKERNDNAAEGMVSVCTTERAGCFRELGRLDEAAAAYEEGIGQC